MVDAADVVVSYIIHSYGGAATTLLYAEQKHKRIIRLSIWAILGPKGIFFGKYIIFDRTKIWYGLFS